MQVILKLFLPCEHLRKEVLLPAHRLLQPVLNGGGDAPDSCAGGV